MSRAEAPYVLGLDGGGTKTEIALVDPAGRVLRLVAGPGLDPTSGEDWQGRLAAMVAGMSPVAARLGLPYFSEVPEISEAQQALATRLLGPCALVRNDVDLGFEGALGGQEGVLVLSGTGSMAWARGRRGTARAGGFGDVFGDEGSAHWIGVQALNLVSRHLDGRWRCAGFAEGLLARLGISGGELIAWTYGAGASRAEVAQVARHVASLADGGEEEARRLLRRAAGELARLARAAARAAGADPRHWSHAGGVLGNPMLRGFLASELGAPPLAPLLPPVGGAALAAARAAGWQTGSDFTGRLALALREAAERRERE